MPKFLGSAYSGIRYSVTYVGSLSKLFGSVCELAVLVEWAHASVKEMFAELGLVLLLERVELALVAIKIVIVALLSQVTQDLARRIVEVALLSILVLRLA